MAMRRALQRDPPKADTVQAPWLSAEPLLLRPRVTPCPPVLGCAGGCCCCGWGEGVGGVGGHAWGGSVSSFRTALGGFQSRSLGQAGSESLVWSSLCGRARGAGADSPAACAAAPSVKTSSERGSGQALGKCSRKAAAKVPTLGDRGRATAVSHILSSCAARLRACVCPGQSLAVGRVPAPVSPCCWGAGVTVWGAGGFLCCLVSSAGGGSRRSHLVLVGWRC